MPTIAWMTQFKRDFKRENKGQYRAILDDFEEPASSEKANVTSGYMDFSRG